MTAATSADAKPGETSSPKPLRNPLTSEGKLA